MKKLTPAAKGTCQLCYTPQVKLQKVATGAWGVRLVCQGCANCYGH